MCSYRKLIAFRSAGYLLIRPAWCAMACLSANWTAGLTWPRTRDASKASPATHFLTDNLIGVDSCQYKMIQYVESSRADDRRDTVIGLKLPCRVLVTQHALSTRWVCRERGDEKREEIAWKGREGVQCGIPTTQYLPT